MTNAPSLAEHNNPSLTTVSRETLLGVVLCGGESKRMGQPKHSCVLGGETLLRRAVRRLLPQVSQVVLSVNRSDIPALQSSHPDLLESTILVLDAWRDRHGPLAGIYSALAYLDGQAALNALVSYPCDTPFLPDNVALRLNEGRWNAPAACASFHNRPHYGVALWMKTTLAPVKQLVHERPSQSLHRALQHCRAVEVSFDNASNDKADSHAFTNINTPDDLQDAHRVLSLQHKLQRSMNL